MSQPGGLISSGLQSANSILVGLIFPLMMKDIRFHQLQ